MLNDKYEAYLADIPLLHSWDNGATWNSGGFGAPMLRQMKETIAASLGSAPPVIAETGAGNSTLMFLFLAPRRLYSVAPDAPLKDRIVEYCAKNEIDHAPLEYIVNRSEVVLPMLAARLRNENALLDVALIDGGHGWPTVFVDFCYLNSVLKKGGLLLVDDLQLYSVNEFARWLSMQPDYSLVKDMKKTLIFRKEIEGRYLRDFGAQPYIVQQTQLRKEAGDPFSIA